MKPKSVAYALRYLGVAVLFAICGAWSASFGYSNNHWAELVMLPIPFALLSALLFMRTARAILVIPLIVGVWVAAYLSALNLGVEAGYLFAVCVGGLFGGLGLALSVSICHRRLLTPPFLVVALIVGAVAALPFGLWHKSGRLQFVRWSVTAHSGTMRVRDLAGGGWHVSIRGVLQRSRKEKRRSYRPPTAARRMIRTFSRPESSTRCESTS